MYIYIYVYEYCTLLAHGTFQNLCLVRRLARALLEFVHCRRAARQSLRHELNRQDLCGHGKALHGAAGDLVVELVSRELCPQLVQRLGAHRSHRLRLCHRHGHQIALLHRRPWYTFSKVSVRTLSKDALRDNILRMSADKKAQGHGSAEGGHDALRTLGRPVFSEPPCVPDHAHRHDVCRAITRPHVGF